MTELASLISVTPVESTKKCSVIENGSCLALNNVEVRKRILGPYPIQDILDGLLSPATISNHLTDILFINAVLASGWILGGKKNNFRNYLFDSCNSCRCLTTKLMSLLPCCKNVCNSFHYDISMLTGT